MFDVRQTPTFRTWLKRLPDRRARERITTRLLRLQHGLFGDAKSVGGGVSELRVDEGPGYRLYFTRHGPVIVVMLAGGDKSTQGRDIKLAQRLAQDQ